MKSVVNNGEVQIEPIYALEKGKNGEFPVYNEDGLVIPKALTDVGLSVLHIYNDYGYSYIVNNKIPAYGAFNQIVVKKNSPTVIKINRQSSLPTTVEVFDENNNLVETSNQPGEPDELIFEFNSASLLYFINIIY